MALDSSQDTTSEWLERALMLVGVALFFTALLITGPLTGLLGILDDPGGENSALTEDSNDTAESTSGEDAITATPGTDDEAGDSAGERTQSDGDEGAASGDGEDEESDDDAEREEEREDEEAEEDEDDEDDQDDDDDDDDDDDAEDGPPGEARGHEDDRGNGNGRGRG